MTYNKENKKLVPIAIICISTFVGVYTLFTQYGEKVFSPDVTSLSNEKKKPSQAHRFQEKEPKRIPQKNVRVPEVSVSGNYIHLETLDKLEQMSDLVIVATVLDDFPKRANIIDKFKDGNISSFATLAKVEIKRILKKPDDLELAVNDTFQISETVAMVPGEKGDVKIKFENYQETRAKSTYILFLKKNMYKNYHVINLNLGKFNIDETDPEDSGDELGEDEKAKKVQLKNEILKKYKDELK